MGPGLPSPRDPGAPSGTLKPQTLVRTAHLCGLCEQQLFAGLTDVRRPGRAVAPSGVGLRQAASDGVDGSER